MKILALAAAAVLGCAPAARHTLPAPPAAPATASDRARAFARTQEQVLCTRRIEDCAGLGPLEVPGRVAADREQYFGDCLTSNLEIFYVRSVGEGQPSREYCRQILENSLRAPLREEELRVLCGKMAWDYRTGDDSMCRELVARPYGGRTVTYKDCAGPRVFAKGEQACLDTYSEGHEDLMNCLRMARILEAASTRDPSRCRERLHPGHAPDFEGGVDRLCQAVMGDPQVCGEGR